MTTKKFKCEYYTITHQVDNTDVGYNLLNWIDQMLELELEQRIRPYKGDNIRLEEAFYNRTYEMWFLRFMRLRTNDIPSFSGMATPSEFMDLNDDQYVSEDVSCLYDPTYDVLMIQKNMHSITPVGVKYYLNSTIEDELIDLKRIVSFDSFDRVGRAERCRTVSVRIADVEGVLEEGNLGRFRSTIGRVLQGMEQAPSPYLELTLSVGKSRDANIEEDEFNLLVQDIRDNPTVFDKAKMRIIEANETKSEMINLISDSPQDEISFEIEGRNPINFLAMMDKLGTKYCPGAERENRRMHIIQCLIR